MINFFVFFVRYNGLTGPNGKPLPPYEIVLFSLSLSFFFLFIYFANSGYSYDANKNVVDARGNVVGFDKDGNPVPLDTTDAFGKNCNQSITFFSLQK